MSLNISGLWGSNAPQSNKPQDEESASWWDTICNFVFAKEGEENAPPVKGRKVEELTPAQVQARTARRAARRAAQKKAAEAKLKQTEVVAEPKLEKVAETKPKQPNVRIEGIRSTTQAALERLQKSYNLVGTELSELSSRVSLLQDKKTSIPSEIEKLNESKSSVKGNGQNRNKQIGQIASQVNLLQKSLATVSQELLAAQTERASLSQKHSLLKGAVQKAQVVMNVVTKTPNKAQLLHKAQTELVAAEMQLSKFRGQTVKA